MSARLLITTEEGVSAELRLGEGAVKLGRAENNTVRVLDKTTSRHHAQILRADGGYWVEDSGSSYGTLLNGRAVTRERLGHMDQLTLGSLRVQFLDEVDVGEETQPILAESIPTEQAEAEAAQGPSVVELREQIREMIEETATLRKALGAAQEENGRQTELGQRQEEKIEAAEEEAARLREVVAELRNERGELLLRIETMGNQLRNERAPRSEEGSEGARQLKEQVKEALRQAEKDRERAVQLEGREAAQLATIAEQKQEIARLAERCQKLEKRESDLQQVVKPALQRVAVLQEQVEKMRIALAQAQDDLKQAQKR